MPGCAAAVQQPPWRSGKLVSLLVRVRYAAGALYAGQGMLRWGLAGGTMQDTTIALTPGKQGATATFDLFAAGIKSPAQVRSLVLSYANESGSGPKREVSFDFIRVEVVVAP